MKNFKNFIENFLFYSRNLFDSIIDIFTPIKKCDVDEVIKRVKKQYNIK